ncbi:MAG: monomethylamine:corrinoid methyltransferase [Deltaproteobacteria bacterium]|nr:monomethylamine:corrinoid methyltransferase [Deltaproteobacteria bacterium]
MALSFYHDTVYRSKHGPILPEKDWELKIFVPKLRELAKKYNIKYDPNNPVPLDDELADRVYQAGLEFYEAVGAYCLDNNRVVKFSRDEIEERVRFAPSEVVFGEGNDRRVVRHRAIEDPTDPPLWISACAASVTQDMFFPIIETYLQEPLNDMQNCPTIRVIDGIEIGVGDPTEFFGATRIHQMWDDARRRVGRPGFPVMNATVLGVSAYGLLGAAQERFGLRPSDGYYFAAVSELKFDMDRLIKSAYLLDWNANLGLLYSPILGGILGGAETTAIANVAYHFMGATVSWAKYFVSFPIHFTGSNTTHRPTLWAINASLQALARNTRFVSWAQMFSRFGPATEMLPYEAAAWALGVIASGANPTFVAFASGGKENYVNPLDSKLIAEICLAAVGMKRHEANELVNKFLSLYEDKLDGPQDTGKTFIELYDVNMRKPKKETVDLYLRKKDELAKLGIPFRS